MNVEQCQGQSERDRASQALGLHLSMPVSLFGQQAPEPHRQRGPRPILLALVAARGTLYTSETPAFLPKAVALMSEVTRILSTIKRGDPRAAAQLLPLVYDELRKLAALQMAHDRQGETLNPTALVHEAYLRLVGAENERRYHDLGHFFAAAATAMRHIRIDQARRKKTHKRGGEVQRLELDEVAAPTPDDELLALDEALTQLAALDA